MRARVVVVAGTRPEAIKLAPVVRAIRAGGRLEAVVVATGQHRELVAPAFALFGIRPDLDLALMRPGQSPADVVAGALGALGPVLAGAGARAVVVQGDTASALAGALAGFYAGLPVAHVEAGLRSGEAGAPVPEEGHRKLIAAVSAIHFAPTPAAGAALLAENIAPERIHVTGNTGVDALLAVDRQFGRARTLCRLVGERFAALDPNRPLVLVTAHRRENHGERLRAITAGVRLIAAGEDAQVVVLVHPNPAVRQVLEAELAGLERVTLLAPVDYLEFVWLLRRAALVLTDSGGVQEEAPVLGTPVLVLRDATERPEGIAAGVATLVGADPARIAGTARAVLRDRAVRAWMSRPLKLYGDGEAGRRVARVLARRFAPAARAPAEPARLAG